MQNRKKRQVFILNKTIFKYLNSFRITFYIFIFSFFTQGLFAQDQSYIDSCIYVLPNMKEDTTKVLMLSDISFYYSKVDPKEGIKYANDAIKMSEKLHYTKGLAISYRFLGINYAAQSLYPQALECYFNAVREFEKINDVSGVAKVHLSIGLTFTNQEDYTDAIKYLNLALTGFDATNNKSAVSKTLNNLGNVYAKQKDFETAISYYTQSQVIKEELGDSSGMESNISNMASVYFESKNIDKALENYFKALEINKSTQNSLFKAVHLSGIGNIYLYIAKDTSVTYLNKYFKGNRRLALNESKKYLEESILLYNELGNLSDLYPFYKSLSETQELTGDIKGALLSYKNYVAAKDSVYNKENVKKTLEMQLKFDYEKKDAIAKQELQRQKLVRNVFVGGFAVMLLFSVIFLNQRNAIKKGKKKSDNLLLNILPSEVAEELKAKGSSDAKLYEEVSILFTDFKGFTQLSEKLKPTDLVAEIDYCFRKFDEIITRYGIEKIKTIGDAYMAVSGLPIIDPNHASKMVSAAIEIRDFMDQYKQERQKENKLFFELRIGIHSGEVVAGIVGVKKFAYDVWGDTVNIAARMESSGEIGRVNVSEATYLLIKDHFLAEYRGEVEAKGKGKVKMYFIENKIVSN